MTSDTPSTAAERGEAARMELGSIFERGFEAGRAESAATVALIREVAADPQNHAFGCAFSRSHLHDEPCNCWLSRLAPAAASAKAEIEQAAVAAFVKEHGLDGPHVVTFTEDGYGLQHPVTCRPDLIGCILNEWLASQPGPDCDPGKYTMTWHDDGPEYALLNTPATPEGGE